MSESGIGIIVLAAGASTRLGKPKQLLHYAGETLLYRAVRTALAAHGRPVIVVLGAQAEACGHELSNLPVHLAINQNWAEGMASSIRCGIAALEAVAAQNVEAVVLSLCDQPFVSAASLNHLIELYQAQHPPLIASEYEAVGEKTCGVPALFSRALFPELLSLHGQEGAKRVITRNAALLVALPEAGVDVDTRDDYQLLRRSEAEGVSTVYSLERY